MKELSIKEKAQRYDEAIELAKEINNEQRAQPFNVMTKVFPELKESSDEEIRKELLQIANESEDSFYMVMTPDKRKRLIAWLEKQGKKHLVNYDEAEKEKADFVGDGFIECHADFLDFKEGNTYWLEYIGDDMYIVRSDNLLGKTYYITPCQLYTVFKKLTWFEKAGYTFDFEKKELKKVERKLAWSEEDGEMCYKVTAVINKLCAEGKEYVWSINTLNKLFYWLKSLKDRYTCKPSDGQIKACKEVYADILSAKGFDLGTINRELNRLEEKLKKYLEE